jgi:TetR/AcrR family transcriptional regulator
MINPPARAPAGQPIERDRDTEQRILDAARAVFVRRGTAGARMQEIAQEAGVNQALLHYYFRSKDRLAEAAFREVAGRILPTVFEILGSDVSIEEKVQRFVSLYIDSLSRSPFLPGYILSEIHHHPERARQLFAAAAGTEPGRFATPLLRKLGDQLGARVRDGTMRRISPEQFAINLISLCIFPFAARPMFQAAFGLDDVAYARFLEQRKRDLPAFFLSALRP